MITGLEHQMCMRTRTRMVLFAAGLFALLALAVTPFVHPPTAQAYDHDYYAFCTENLGQKAQFCCSNAGGEWSNGSCTDPAALPSPLPTITQQVLPPVIVAPAH